MSTTVHKLCHMKVCFLSKHEFLYISNLSCRQVLCMIYSWNFERRWRVDGYVDGVGFFNGNIFTSHRQRFKSFLHAPIAHRVVFSHFVSARKRQVLDYQAINTGEQNPSIMMSQWLRHLTACFIRLTYAHPRSNSMLNIWFLSATLSYPGGTQWPAKNAYN